MESLALAQKIVFCGKERAEEKMNYGLDRGS